MTCRAIKKVSYVFLAIMIIGGFSTLVDGGCANQNEAPILAPIGGSIDGSLVYQNYYGQIRVGDKYYIPSMDVDVVVISINQDDNLVEAGIRLNGTASFAVFFTPQSFVEQIINNKHFILSLVCNN